MLGVRVLPVSARSGKGIDQLVEILRVPGTPPVPGRFSDQPDALLRGEAHALSRRYGPGGELLVRSQARMDRFFLHSITGGISFFLIMYLLFQSIFTWAAPVMDAVEFSLAWMADRVGFAVSCQWSVVRGDQRSF